MPAHETCHALECAQLLVEGRGVSYDGTVEFLFCVFHIFRDLQYVSCFSYEHM